LPPFSSRDNSTPRSHRRDLRAFLVRVHRRGADPRRRSPFHSKGGLITAKAVHTPEAGDNIFQRGIVKLYGDTIAGENQMSEPINIPDKPIMPAAAVARLERALAQSECYLEYGSGGSTSMANRLGVPVSISVESDKAWLETLKAGLILTPSVRRIFLHADIGPTREWGHPVDESKWRTWHEYPLGAWRTCLAESLDPDVVLIDGRFRKACFYATLIFGRPGATILFDDYENRPFYQEVEKFVRPSLMYDRLAEFTVPEIADKNTLWLAFADAVTDQR